MFFTCPKCNTVYDVPADRADNARKLRCATCGHLWVPEIDTQDMAQEPEYDQEIGQADNVDELFEEPIIPRTFATEDKEPDFSDFKPIFQEPEKPSAVLHWVKPLYFFSIICIGVAIYAYFFHTPKKFPLSVQSINAEFVEKDYQRTAFLNALIKNETDKDVIVKSFKVIFYDENKNELMETTVATPEEVFGADKITPLKLDIGRPPAQATRAVLEIQDLDR